jgi:hypothetical protein
MRAQWCFCYFCQFFRYFGFWHCVCAWLEVEARESEA